MTKFHHLVLIALFLLCLTGCLPVSEKLVAKESSVKPTPKCAAILKHNQNLKLINAIAITIDLCPSKRPYEKKLFQALADLGDDLKRPLPVAICISGNWINQHEKELTAIRKMKLNITWVNHSLTHPVENDFCVNPRVNFTREVRGNFELMKRAGLPPSVFFRFPGLRYNIVRLEQLGKMGYLALAADAWLAKGEKIRPGSIILVHGNGNEPKGIKILLNYLKQSKPQLLKGEIEIVPVEKFLLTPSSPVG